MARTGKTIDPLGSPTIAMSPVQSIYGSGLAGNFPDQSGMQYFTTEISGSATITVMALQGPGVVKYLEADANNAASSQPVYIRIYVDDVLCLEHSIGWAAGTNRFYAYVGTHNGWDAEDMNQRRAIDMAGICFERSFLVTARTEDSAGAWGWISYWRLTR